VTGGGGWRRRVLVATLVVGLVSSAIGLIGLDIANSALDRIAAHGAHVVATVVEADTSDKGFRFQSHLIVTFPGPAGGIQRARVWVEEERYQLGQPLPVVYDPAHPQFAQLEKPDAVIGPERAPLFVAVIVGSGLLIYVAGGVVFRLIRRIIT
jgi:hypothetical protein